MIPALLAAHWPLVALGLAALIALIGIVMRGQRRRRRTRERHRAPDVLDPGAAPAHRNQALIDAPPSAQTAPAGPTDHARAFSSAVESLRDSGTSVTAGENAANQGIESVFRSNLVGKRSSELTRIKGLGPKLAARLGALGVTRLDQIAAWDAAELARIDGELGAFAGRPTRDGWVEQARLLSAGDVAGYEAKFGRL